ncbi:MAG: sulfatase-like hydrolase/transferase [Cytophagales bacterium]|nr:sulfatase-like hydrolase/transferase [Cytophagales bacterium]
MRYGDVIWYQEVLFWLFFFLFNFSLFAFHTLIQFKARYLNPFQMENRMDHNALFFSFNPDFYRISVDVSLIVLLYRWLTFDQGIIAATLYYSFLLLYSIYHYAFSKIYQVYPIFSNDFRLILNAFGILWGESKVKVVFSSLLAAIMIIGLSAGFHQLLAFSSQLPPNWITLFLSLTLVLYVIVGIWKYGIYRPKSDTAMRILIAPLRIAFNVINSWKLVSRLKRTNFDQLDQSRNTRLNLAQKPNIYCLFVESYGSILLKEERLSKRFLQDFSTFKNALSAAGWKITSNLSESVSPVGPSWLAYTSVLFGSKVANNFAYEFLLNKAELYRYDTLMKVFMKEGYQSYHLNATQPKAGVMVPYRQMASFFGIDQWILARDMDYSGPVYGFTESPADQYVLNFAQEKIKRELKEDPFILFYLTKNSHSPFISPSEVVPDWKTLNHRNQENIGQEFLQEPTHADYQKAITYQLDFLSDFILKQAHHHDIFLLIGDHQPHVLGDHVKYGNETLIHVISKDQGFIQGFDAYGFQDSLENLTCPIKHEGIYSMFIREIMRAYGKPGKDIPPYEKDGVLF